MFEAFIKYVYVECLMRVGHACELNAGTCAGQVCGMGLQFEYVCVKCECLLGASIVYTC